MAYFEVNFFSPALGFPTDIQVYIPTPYSDDILTDKPSDYFTEGTRWPVLYLLHGAYGDFTDWGRLTSIERYAAKHKMAVVMPSAANSFYQDMVYGTAVLSYLTEDLMPFVEKNFPVSSRREDTFAAGLSMGGYGALRLALEAPERFAACASLSGAVDLALLCEEAQRTPNSFPFLWESLLGEAKQVAGTRADLFHLIRTLKEAGRPVPRIYQTVGTEDFLYALNVQAREKLTAAGAEVTYAEHPGIHDWVFWDAYVQDVLEWMRPAAAQAQS